MFRGLNEASCCARGRAHSGMTSSAPSPSATSEFGIKSGKDSFHVILNLFPKHINKMNGRDAWPHASGRLGDATLPGSADVSSAMPRLHNPARPAESRRSRQPPVKPEILNPNDGKMFQC
jgi:hypothetical protein